MNASVKQDQASARAELGMLVKEGQVIYTNVKHVSQSGMTRGISFHTVNRAGRLITLDFLVMRLLRLSSHRSGGVTIRGTGLDVANKTVQDIALSVFGSIDALSQEAI